MPRSWGVICTRSDYYYTSPSLEKSLDANGDCYVENLSIGREGYGSVLFPGPTNVANLDIDTIGECSAADDLRKGGGGRHPRSGSQSVLWSLFDYLLNESSLMTIICWHCFIRLVSYSSLLPKKGDHSLCRR